MTRHDDPAPEHGRETSAPELHDLAAAPDTRRDTEPDAGRGAVTTAAARALCETLPPDTQRAWALLGLVSWPGFLIDFAAALFGVPVDDAAEVLADLHAAELITMAGYGIAPGEWKWRIPAAFTDVAAAAGNALPAPDRTAAIDRLLTHTQEVVERTAAIAQPYRLPDPGDRTAADTPGCALLRLDALQQIVVAVARLAADHGRHDVVLALAAGMWAPERDHRIAPDVWAALDQAAVRAAQALGDQYAEGKARKRPATCHIRSRNFGAARECLTRTAALWTELGEPEELAEIERRRGHLAAAAGAPAQALRSLAIAKTAFTELAQWRSVALTEIDEAAAHLELGDPETAAELARTGYEHLFEQSPDDPVSLARALIVRGRAAQRMARPTQAITLLRQAIAMGEQASSASIQTKALKALVSVYTELGDEDQADQAQRDFRALLIDIRDADTDTSSSARD